MNDSQLSAFEYKAPSYELRDRGDPGIDFDAYSEKRRFYYDARSGMFKSGARVKKSVSLLFAGELLCQEKLIAACSKTGGGFDFPLCFEYIRPLLKSADFAAGCLKTPVSHTAPYRGEIMSHEGPHFHNAPIQYLQALSDAGFDLLTTEGNHCLDTGARGLLETIGNIRRLGMIQTGTTRPADEKFVIIDICGFKIGLTAFGGGYNDMRRNLTADGKDALLNPYSSDHAASVYRAMKAKGAEYTVCFPHWGREHTEALTDRQVQTAEELTQIGYDLVLGTHPHTLQQFKLVNNKPVAFSLGSLMSASRADRKDGEYTALCRLRLKRTDGSIAAHVEFIPCKIAANYKGIPYTAVPVAAGLGLLDTQEPQLNKLPQRMVRRLGCRQSRVRLDYPVDADAFMDIRRMEVLELPARLAALKPYEKRELFPEPIVVPQKRFWESVSYVEDKKCLYRISGDSADLIQFGRAGDTVTLPHSISSLPVRSIRCSGGGNDTTRLIYVGKFVEIIGSGAFRGFTALESIRLFRNLKSIEDRAFACCTRLTGIILPCGMQSIGTQAFADCRELLSIKIPPSVTAISADAFSGCGKLTIYCEEGSCADTYARSHGISVCYMPLAAGAQAEEGEDAENDS